MAFCYLFTALKCLCLCIFRSMEHTPTNRICFEGLIIKGYGLVIKVDIDKLEEYKHLHKVTVSLRFVP